MQWYRTGTITVTNGSATVTGASTLWSDVGTLNPGDILNGPDGKLYEILTINSNTGITLNSVYLGSSLSGQAYSIMPIGLLPSTLAQSVKTTLATANTALASTVRYDINSMGLSLTQQQNARTNIAALSALDVGSGYLSKSVAGSVDVTLSAVEASNQMITLTGAITANINVIVPAAQRLFFIQNSTTGAFTVTVKTLSGTGIAVAQGGRTIVACDATNVVNPLTTITAGFSSTGNISINGASSSASNLILANTTYGGTASAIYKHNNGNLIISRYGVSDDLIVDVNGNVGLGLAPSPSTARTIEFGNLGSTLVSRAANTVELNQGIYYSGGAYLRAQSGYPVASYEMQSGAHYWLTANIGAVNSAVSLIQSMTLTASGDLCLYATSTTTTNGGIALSASNGGTGSSAVIVGHPAGTTSGNYYCGFGFNGSLIGSITQNGTTAVLYNTTSDYRLKTDVASITGTEALARLSAVRPVDFTWISDGSKDAGFIAHEFQATYSRNVTGEKDGTEQQEYEITPAVPATHDADGTELTAAIPAVMGTRTVPKYQQMDNSAAVPDLVAAVTYLAQQHATIAADFAAYKTAHP